MEAQVNLVYKVMHCVEVLRAPSESCCLTYSIPNLDREFWSRWMNPIWQLSVRTTLTVELWFVIHPVAPVWWRALWLGLGSHTAWVAEDTGCQKCQHHLPLLGVSLRKYRCGPSNLKTQAFQRSLFKTKNDHAARKKKMTYYEVYFNKYKFLMAF